MARFARVERGIVREILEADILPPFTEEITAQFREVSIDVLEGWIEINGSLVAPTPPIIEPTPQELISEAFEQIQSKEARDALRPYITEGFVALTFQNVQSLQDIFTNAINTLGVANEEIAEFLSTVADIFDFNPEP